MVIYSSFFTAALIRLSNEDRDISFAVDDTGYICQSRSEHNWGGARATVGVNKGWYERYCLSTLIFVSTRKILLPSNS